MKQINVSDKAAREIEILRDSKINSYGDELEGILETLSGLNNMMCSAKDDEAIAFYADTIHQAQDKILSYFELLKVLSYENDIRQDGKVQVTQME